MVFPARPRVPPLGPPLLHMGLGEGLTLHIARGAENPAMPTRVSRGFKASLAQNAVFRRFPEVEYPEILSKPQGGVGKNPGVSPSPKKAPPGGV